ncbi:ECF-type sigma factor [Paludisphaera mucosa]|uniref:ECF-type sigma factor n=1 Tax=Paludisphaera mucosa TaxID=3030827 RepID=A0ABT6F5C0_9BACT|nr:ECF-type sigma factor [Paludisphaera mucosa]MDG3002605.1 ECF-type sigma factor [Paludisphaera mucosa]
MDKPDGEGSVTCWVGDLKAGDHAAADALWRRYFEALVRLARQRLRPAAGGGSVEDEEDAALSAFRSLCAGAARGRFDRLHNRDDLWRLLVVITARKVLDQAERRRRLKRGGGRVVDEAALDGLAPDGAGLAGVVGAEPTPEFAALIAEEFRARLDQLGDDTLRQVALWRMDGYSNEEIAAKLGCVARSVERKLNLIRRVWLGEGGGLEW